MEQVICQKHKLKKEFVFCLEFGCKDRLVCEKCFMMDRQHSDHQRICIKYFMKDDEDELVRVFNKTYAETIKDSHNVEQFSNLLDARFDKFMDEREESIRLPFERMINDYRLSMQKLKIQLHQKYKVNEVRSVAQIKQAMQQLIENNNSEQKQQEMKEIIDSSNQIIEIQNKLDSVFKQIEQDDIQIVNGIQNVIDNYKAKMYSQLETNTNNLESAKQLTKCTEIAIIDASEIDQYRSQIEQYWQEGKQFKIFVNFYSISNLKQIKQVAEMIEQSNANHRVAEIGIKIHDENENDMEQIIKMLNTYTNLFHFEIFDYSDQVNNKVHDQLKALVKRRTVLTFRLWYGGFISSSDDGLKLIKQYNQIIIKDKDHLECLQYERHSRIDKSAEQKEQIQQLIDEVSNI